MTKKDLEILYSPIGGAGQIGMNLYLYGYKGLTAISIGSWLIVG